MQGDATERERKPRADSLRNREQLIAAAKAAFTERGAEVPLEDIAREAGVGIGTLYRHFPAREALLAAVYSHEVEHLVAAADRLLAERPPLDALEGWMHQLVDYMATKRVIGPALQATPAQAAKVYAASTPTLVEAMNRLARAVVASGDVRAELEPDDLIRLMVGLTQGYDRPDWAPSVRRLIAITVAGLRAG